MDNEKIEELIGLYREGLIYFIYRYVKDLDAAEDLAEDVFVDVIVHPDRFRGAASEKTYLYTMGRNKAVDFIRHNKRQENFIYHQKDESDVNDIESRYSLEEEVLKEERKEELFRAMRELKEEYRVALHLVYLEEMSYDEAGKVMKKSRKQIENFVYRGKKALKELLTEGIS